MSLWDMMLILWQQPHHPLSTATINHQDTKKALLGPLLRQHSKTQLLEQLSPKVQTLLGIKTLSWLSSLQIMIFRLRIWSRSRIVFICIFLMKSRLTYWTMNGREILKFTKELRIDGLEACLFLFHHCIKIRESKELLDFTVLQFYLATRDLV